MVVIEGFDLMLIMCVFVEYKKYFVWVFVEWVLMVVCV